MLFWKSSARATRDTRLPLDTLGRPGCFETLRVYGGHVFGLESHLQRFEESHRAIHLDFPWGQSELKKWVKASLVKSKAPDAMARLVSYTFDKAKPELSLSVRPFTGYAERLYKEGVEVRTLTSPLDGVGSGTHHAKFNFYLPAILGSLSTPSAIRDRVYEQIHLTPDGCLAEGTVSNVFIVKRGTLWTPPAACGILMGVTRHHVLFLAKQLGIEVRETPITRHDAYTADEMFLSNTSSEVMPIVRYDNRVIGPGKPGSTTRKIHQAFRLLVRGESIS